MAGAFAMAPLAARLFYPNLPEMLNAWSIAGYAYLLSPKIFSLTTAGCLWLLICLQFRPGWRATAVGLLMAVLLAESGREITDIVLSFTAK